MAQRYPARQLKTQLTIERKAAIRNGENRADCGWFTIDFFSCALGFPRFGTTKWRKIHEGHQKPSLAKDFSHITQSTTFGELKQLLPATSKERIPGIAQLRDSAVVVLKAKTGCGIIEVYDNGFFTYIEDEHITVYAVDRCAVLEWRSCTGEILTSEGANVSELPWTMPLEIAGTNRLEHNSNSREKSVLEYSLDTSASANNILFSVLPEHERKEALEDERQFRGARNNLLSNALAKLTSNQKELVRVVFIEKHTQEEAAAILGISQSNVSRRISTIKHLLEKFL